MGRWVVACAITGTVLIGLGAFWLSFTALADLARRAGTPESLSWVWPLIVDGVIVVATISVVALSGHGVRATRYPWLLLAGGAAVSVSANITHALIAADSTVPPVLAALVASVPPIVLLAITHLTVELTRHQRHTPIGATYGHVRPTTVEAKVEVAREPKRGVSQRSFASAGRVAITDGPAVEARRLRETGMSNRKIAHTLGVHPSTVGRWFAAEPVASGSSTKELTEGDEHGAEHGTDEDS
ncbi:MAG: DUF2637 domain-containing protein [Microbacterium sp.]